MSVNFRPDFATSRRAISYPVSTIIIIQTYRSLCVHCHASGFDGLTKCQMPIAAVLALAALITNSRGGRGLRDSLVSAYVFGASGDDV
jgi:hypothetical protein